MAIEALRVPSAFHETPDLERIAIVQDIRAMGIVLLARPDEIIPAPSLFAPLGRLAGRMLNHAGIVLMDDGPARTYTLLPDVFLSV